MPLCYHYCWIASNFTHFHWIFTVWIWTNFMYYSTVFTVFVCWEVMHQEELCSKLFTVYAFGLVPDTKQIFCYNQKWYASTCQLVTQKCSMHCHIDVSYVPQLCCFDQNLDCPYTLIITRKENYFAIQLSPLLLTTIHKSNL